MEIERLSKEKVMRPSLIDTVDKVNEVIDVVEPIDHIVETIEHSAILTQTTTGNADGAIISVTANGHAEQDGTPTPSDPKEIVVVRGRNLATGIEVGSFNGDGVETEISSRVRTGYIPVTGGETYVISGHTTASKTVQHAYYWYDKADGTAAIGKMEEWQANGPVAVAPANAKYLRVVYRYSDNSVPTLEDMRCQVELGSTAHPYVPYGHVGLDVTADGKTTTTPIPLPSRGWVGSLPDGTHDALSIDGAGKVTWKCATAEADLGSLSWSLIGTGTYNRFYSNGLVGKIKPPARGVDVANILSSSYIVKSFNDAYATASDHIIAVVDQASGARGNVNVVDSGYSTTADFKSGNAGSLLYYELATPTTEDMGYVDLPDIPEGAVVSMPELESFGVESWNNNTIYRYVNALVARAVQ
jgi:hypothetical protein